jgi:diguanylate cyclase (GGDEF)-like protein
MHLDIPTLMAMGSFLSACTGVVLLVAWWQNRKILPLALWGLADIVAAGGILSLMLGSELRQPLGSIFGGCLLALAHGLIWKSGRILEAKPAQLVFLLLGLAVLGLVGLIPAMRAITASLGLTINAIYMFATTATLWEGRNERLHARLPLIVLTAAHASVLSIGACSTLAGSPGPNPVPSVMSLFGLIHFENNIFMLGTAVFLLALVKERGEAASRLAANADPLTGISNRSAFMENAARLIERCRHDGMPVSVIMFDLDRFKAINDTYGHAAGDAVIRIFCEVTAGALRPNDIFGRIGGEEFGVVLPGLSIEAAYVRAERIRATFAESCRSVGSSQVNATVSGGLSASLNAGQPLSELLEYSDDALYRAKAEGRNRIKRSDQATPESSFSRVIRIA